jgi:hypothetical protein
MTEPDDDVFVVQSLRELPKVEPSAALLRRVAQIPISHPRREASVAVWGGWQWALGLLGAALLGISAGWLTIAPSDDLGPGLAENTTEPKAELQDVDVEESELEGMLALAWGSEEQDWSGEVEAE